MFNPSCLLISVLLDPALIERFCAADWELCIRQARRSELLTRLAVTIREHRLEDRVPLGPRRHLVAAVESHLHLRQAIRNEVEYLLDALEKTGIPLVLLKGAAYEMAGLPPGRCRTFNDIDLLVPKNRLKDAETALLLNGWTSRHHDAYDEYYYRTWMHEIPPLHHLSRESVIDMHHSLVPETAPMHPDPEKLLGSVVCCPERKDIFVLSQNDMILHSAVHLFNDGEFDHGLRDLFDIRDLVTHSVTTEEDWLILVERAKELDLSRPFYHATRYLKLVLQMPVPESLLERLADGRFSAYGQWVMDELFLRGLQPDHRSCGDLMTPLSRYLLYVRGHALRMPLRLLLPHLARKGMKRLREEYSSRNENTRGLN